MRIFSNGLRRIAGVIDDDFLRGDENAHRSLEALDIEHAIVALEFHQVQRGEIAGGVVEEDVFRAGIGGMNRLGALAGVPFLHRAIVLEAGVSANPCAFRDFLEEFAGVLLIERPAGGDGARPPFPPFERGPHEFVADAHGKVFVLIHHAAVGVAVVGTVVALFDERPGFSFLLLLAVDELLDVAVPVAQRVHLRGAARLAAGLHDVGDLVVNLEEGQWTAGPAAAAEFFLAGTDGRKVCARPGPVFEEHRFAVGQLHDGLHVIVHRLDEAGAALRIFVLGRSALGLAGLAVVIPVSAGGIFPDAVLMVETDIEPDRRIERAVLIHAEPGQFIAENFAVRLAEIAVLDSPIRDGAADPMNELLHGRLAFRGVLFAVKIF